MGEPWTEEEKSVAHWLYARDARKLCWPDGDQWDRLVSKLREVWLNEAHELLATQAAARARPEAGAGERIGILSLCMYCGVRETYPTPEALVDAMTAHGQTCKAGPAQQLHAAQAAREAAERERDEGRIAIADLLGLLPAVRHGMGEGHPAYVQAVAGAKAALAPASAPAAEGGA